NCATRRKPTCPASRTIRPTSENRPAQARKAKVLRHAARPQRTRGRNPRGGGSELELVRFCRVLECKRGRLAARDDLGHLIEVAGTDLALVPRRRIPVRLAGEFGFLELGVGGHAPLFVFAGKLEHPMVERVEAGERYELEFVSHFAELDLKVRNGSRVELL